MQLCVGKQRIGPMNRVQSLRVQPAEVHLTTCCVWCRTTKASKHDLHPGLHEKKDYPCEV
jgi:hypothetical protein